MKISDPTQPNQWIDPNRGHVCSTFVFVRARYLVFFKDIAEKSASMSLSFGTENPAYSFNARSDKNCHFQVDQIFNYTTKITEACS